MLKHSLKALLLAFVLVLAPVLALADDAAPAEPAAAQADPMLMRYLGIKGNGAGRFSADGKWFAFSTGWTGVAQKWLMPVDGGFPQQITYGNDATAYCDFSFHDPKLMVMGGSAGGNEREQIYTIHPDGTGQTPVAYDPAVFHNMGDWSRDGRWISYDCNKRDEKFFDIYVQEMSPAGAPVGEPRIVMQQDGILGAGSFSPDGTKLIVDEALNNVNNNVYLVDLTTGTNLLLTPHEGEANFASFTWADNQTLYFLTNENREFMAIAKMDVSNPKLFMNKSMQPRYEIVQSPEMDVENINISDDGSIIAWAVNEGGFGRANVARLPDFSQLKGANGQALAAPKLPSGLQAVGRFDRQGRYLVLQVSSPGSGPGDMYRYNLKDGSTLRLTYASLGGLDPASFTEPKLVTYKGYDGLDLSAIWYEPKGPKPAGGWPVIVEAHGGPEGQTRAWFDPQAQLYLSKGIAILAPNPRGSAGYGKTFMTLDNITNRQKSIDDYAAAFDWLVAQGIGDAKRIAITGGSYGGYVVLASLTSYPAKWCAGVDSFGIANFISFLENTAPYRRPLREAEYGFLEADHDFLVAQSPLNHVDQIKAPLLILQGANDPRVPLSEAQQMYDALKARNHDVGLVVFSDEGHGWQKLENRAIAWQREIEFLGRIMGF